MWLSVYKKVLRLFVVLIDIAMGKIRPQVPYIWQGLYSLMIRVNTAHGLHFYRRAGRNNTIAKIQPIWEKNNKKQHLTAQNALHPREQPQLLLHVRRRELWEKWLLRWKWLCVCLCMCEYVCVRVSRGWIERHSVKKIFQKHFASVTLTRAVDWHALLDRNQNYQPICHALRMAWSSGRGLSGKWCCSRHSLSTMCVCICECVSAEDGKVFNQRFDWKTLVSLKIIILYTDV